jgi:acetolactate synthase I/II/III large subunit
MNVAAAVGRALTAAGVRQVFGVVGSGNFHLTNAMVAAGARFVAARHEGGAATMADAYSRMSGTVAALSVHQGCGLTNAMTGIAEAAKSRTPMLVVAAEATEPRSNFHVDQDALARSVGAVPMRITSAETAVAEALEAVVTAVSERRTVLLNVPLSLQALEAAAPVVEAFPSRNAVVPDVAEVGALTDLLRRADRPVFVAGRGARGHRKTLESLAERSGALLATSAVAHGLFHGNPWDLGISGGFASPRTAELIRDADLIVGWGCALNMWTMRHGQLIGPDTTVAQIDDDASALGAHRDIQLGVTGDVELTAALVLESYGDHQAGYRTAELGSVRWRDVAFDDESTGERIDPRTLSIALDDMLPAERVVAVDSGNFMGYPSVCLSVPDENGFCFTQAFQSIGLGLATAIGAALAQPDRLPVAVLGDGGALMSAVELDTVRRLGLPMLVVVYNDDAYGAEVHHFGPDGHALETVTFPPTDIAAIGRGYGFEAVTVRGAEDLTAIEDWVNGPRSAPMLVDAKVVAEHPSWWLEEAFRG